MKTNLIYTVQLLFTFKLLAILKIFFFSQQKVGFQSLEGEGCQVSYFPFRLAVAVAAALVVS